MTQHTPTPWKLAGQGDGTKQLPILGSNGKIIAAIRDHGHLSDGYRIVACVNACEGINPEAVPKLLEALQSMLRGADLVMAEMIDGGKPYPTLTHAIGKARAAIAKATDKEVTP